MNVPKGKNLVGGGQVNPYFKGNKLTDGGGMIMDY